VASELLPQSSTITRLSSGFRPQHLPFLLSFYSSFHLLAPDLSAVNMFGFLGIKQYQYVVDKCISHVPLGYLLLALEILASNPSAQALKIKPMPSSNARTSRLGIQHLGSAPINTPPCIKTQSQLGDVFFPCIRRPLLRLTFDPAGSRSWNCSRKMYTSHICSLIVIRLLISNFTWPSGVEHASLLRDFRRTRWQPFSCRVYL